LSSPGSCVPYFVESLKASSQWEKLPKKQSVGVHFDNMALYFECRINKNAAL